MFLIGRPNLEFITTQIGKTLVSSRPGWTVVVQPPDNHMTMSIEYTHVGVYFLTPSNSHEDASTHFAIHLTG